ncbi:MAG TPA: hypothetical protein VMM76_06395 [Pirellulaceae bacterium]|nr:hypothetical protein [Pirellulaceae bacterium]
MPNNVFEGDWTSDKLARVRKYLGNMHHLTVAFSRPPFGGG